MPPYPHARNGCQVCRERDADFEVTSGDPLLAGSSSSLLCQRCLGGWAIPHVAMRGGRAAMTLAWAPGRLAGHGLTGGDQ